jgi:uncharacterized protein (DUF427 family)
MRATWNGAVIAEADGQATHEVEGNIYFPRSAVRPEYLRPSDTHTTCGWKGVASYFHLEVAGALNKDAAWYYPEPTPAAAKIAGYVAFWRGIEIERGS